MKKRKQSKIDVQFTVQVAIAAFLLGVLITSLAGGNMPSGSIGTVSASEIIPTGVPSVYGKELKISYDAVSPDNQQLADQTIATLSAIDKSETLEGEDLQRYIDILYNLEDGISCEYCCGARSVIFDTGEPACGCAHSYAMRGLTKYLIKYHGDEYTNEEILEEVGKWKVLFFPGIMEAKAAILEENGVEFNYINLASNKYRGIEQGQSSGGDMVGGC
ncbi:hypothetical protein ACFLZJ_01710 [Nanoarchaeota archaeon]